MRIRSLPIAASNAARQHSPSLRGMRVALPTMASVLALSIGIGAAQAQISGTYDISGDPDNQAIALGGNTFGLSSTATTYSWVDFTPNISIVGDQLSSLAANFGNVVGGAGGGSPRLVVDFANNQSLLAYLGTPPSFNDNALSLSAFSGFNLINSTNNTGIGPSGF
jgi:hypothetical protein